MGRALDCKSSQAIGQALKRNPWAPEVPCHRVISSNLQIGGYCGHTVGEKIQRKLALLKEEGILFENGILTDKSKIFHFAH
jgi:methylated-DNA-[protein]-cysteine S-methyltransferase